MILCMTTGQCRIFHDLPTFIENVPTTFNFNYLPAKIKMQIISEVQTAQLLTCLRVSKLFYSLIFGKLYKFRGLLLYNIDF